MLKHHGNANVLGMMKFTGSNFFICTLRLTMVSSFARFTPYKRGKIGGKAEAGAALDKICKEALKKDGQRAGIRAIPKVIKHARDDSKWEGEDSAAGGRPPALDKKAVCMHSKFVRHGYGLLKWCRREGQWGAEAGQGCKGEAATQPGQ